MNTETQHTTGAPSGNAAGTPRRFTGPAGPAARWIALAPACRSVLRITAAAMFMLAGTINLFAFPVGIPPNGGTVALFSQVGIGAVLQVLGGGLLLLGLFTRPVAFILSGEMAVAYFQFHAPQGFWPNANGGIPAVLYCFLWLYFSAAGPGPWSLDAVREARRPKATPPQDPPRVQA